MSAIRILGLSDEDQFDLAQHIGPDAKPVEAPTPDDSGFGEPMTTMLVVAIAPQMVAAIAVWIAKRRKKSSLDVEIQRELPDGTIEKRIIHAEQSDSDAPDPNVVNQLKEAIGTASSETKAKNKD